MHTYDEVKAVLLDISSERPDYVYAWLPDPRIPDGPGSCFYTDPEGNPSCIIGHVFECLGTPRPSWGEEDNGNPVGTVLARSKQKENFSLKAREFLAQVQINQDGGMYWGAAVEHAIKGRWGSVLGVPPAGGRRLPGVHVAL